MGLLLESANCADINTLLPATGDVVAAVTRYLNADPATVVTVDDVPETPLGSVAVNVVEVDAAVCVVKVTVAKPKALVALLGEANVPCDSLC